MVWVWETPLYGPLESNGQITEDQLLEGLHPLTAGPDTKLWSLLLRHKYPTYLASNPNLFLRLVMLQDSRESRKTRTWVEATPLVVKSYSWYGEMGKCMAKITQEKVMCPEVLWSQGSLGFLFLLFPHHPTGNIPISSFIMKSRKTKQSRGCVG